jgi:hypothetical protein
MLETYFVSLGVAVRPICVALEKYSRISRHAESSAALPRWHSSTTIRSKKPGENSRYSFCRSSGPGDRLIEPEVDLVGGVDAPLACRWQW